MRAPRSPQVSTAVLVQRWRTMTFLHWRYPAQVVQRLLPANLTVHTFDGAAWVGLLPFLMEDVRPPRLPAVPWLSRFPETNVRTYVHGPDGAVGLYFFSLDAGRLPAVVAARASLRLPYFWSDLAVEVDGDTVRYRGRRRTPGPDGAGYDLRVRFGQAYRDAELTAFDHFLTARYRLYSQVAGRLVAVDVAHPPWPLRRGNLVDLRQDVVQAAGLPAPAQPPALHASDGVDVRVGFPHLVRART
ncbi:YqjF family protein [Micromonospora sp. KC723]|uniref:YqjF family protein n=1 Tax=Micromonospora sp. KC723 TaxID=2530381 RepID=UPI001049DA00|nr:DUF2071 domain-containing protein [Micromonospora sp. KC723]TDB73146.1 DUF2071 domain-containing protein [Micromonospora sp. KC723]